MGPLRYLFLDMNSYFASVEQQDQPRLRGRPVGVVPTMVATTCCIAASYEAKACGVKTGTGVLDAKRLCPGIKFTLARPERYVEVHHQIIEAAESCLHIDYVCSIDEMYGRLLGVEREPEGAARVAHAVKAAIRDKVGEYVRCSIGIAPNPWLAKVATDLQKPDGMVMILPEQMPEKICTLKLTDLPGIADGMSVRLQRHGVHTVAQLCRLSQEQLSEIWESKVLGSIWWHQLNAYDLPYRPTHRRTVGHSHVLPPEWRTDAGARAVMARMIHKAAARMRRIEYVASHMTARIGYMDAPGWKRRAPLGMCGDTLTMIRVLRDIWWGKPLGTPLQVAVQLEGLVPLTSATLSLFDEPRYLVSLAGAMDRIDLKYGRHTIYFGAMFGAQDTAPTRISYTQIPSAEEFRTL
jgi:DNA polymerase-4